MQKIEPPHIQMHTVFFKEVKKITFFKQLMDIKYNFALLFNC